MAPEGPCLGGDRRTHRFRRVGLAPGGSAFLGQVQTGTWGFNGDYLGPTLRANLGDEVVARVSNRLAEATTLHWHGMHLPATADGGPHQLVAPGETWTASWKIVQPAATLWYHAHPEGRTGSQVYRGAAGLFLLDEPATEPSDLPIATASTTCRSSSRTGVSTTTASSASTAPLQPDRDSRRRNPRQRHPRPLLPGPLRRSGRHLRPAPPCRRQRSRDLGGAAGAAAGPTAHGGLTAGRSASVRVQPRFTDKRADV